MDAPLKIHFQRYACALAIVMVAFSAYVLLAVPSIELSTVLRPGGQGKDRPVDATRPLIIRHREKVEHLFPPGSWQLDKPKVLETEHGTLLFRDYKPLDNGRMELKPLTLILRAQTKREGSDAAPRSFVLDAPDGAVLQFDGATDPARASFGRLVAGLLQGNIRVYSPPTTDAANDALSVTTKNIQLDERRIWTPHEVKFSYGKSYGEGQDLVITLLPSQKVSRSGSPAVDGVKSLELVHVTKFHIELGDARMLPTGRTPAAAAEDTSKRRMMQAPIEVKCQGPFLFDFEEKIASFEDQVELHRLNPRRPQRPARLPNAVDLLPIGAVPLPL
jgi:hypothetical protein